MILVDTSVWIDHFRRADAGLQSLLERSAVLGHPFIFGEIALGSLRDRATILDALSLLPQALRAEDREVMTLIDQAGLSGTGIGWVDAHLLAAVRLTQDARLLTNDRRLAAVASDLGIAA